LYGNIVQARSQINIIFWPYFLFSLYKSQMQELIKIWVALAQQPDGIQCAFAFRINLNQNLPHNSGSIAKGLCFFVVVVAVYVYSFQSTITHNKLTRFHCSPYKRCLLDFLLILAFLNHEMYGKSINCQHNFCSL
jgi:hypothetical protein